MRELVIGTCSTREQAIEFDTAEDRIAMQEFIKRFTNKRIILKATEDGKYLYFRNEDGNNYLEYITL